jgi:hypothetical protein
LEKEEIEQVEKEFEKLYPLPSNRKNLRSRKSKQSESTAPMEMACENDEIVAEDIRKHEIIFQDCVESIQV